MSECKGEDCTDKSHEAAVVETPTRVEEAMAVPQQRNPIITPGDLERFPLLEMNSQLCNIPLSAEDEEAIAFMDAILTELDDQAAGLAAVQVGYPRRIFLLRNITGEEGKTENSVYINPSVISMSKETKRSGEACLSLPGMGVQTRRPKSLTLRYFDFDGNIQTQNFTGFWAKCIMHEMDHLNGKLISSFLEKQIAKQPSRTSFGMTLSPHRLKVIAHRRAKRKRTGR